MNSIPGQSSTRSSARAEIYDWVAEAWAELEPLTSHELTEKQQEYRAFLEQLAQLHSEPFLTVWKEHIEDRVALLGLLDLDGDGQDELFAISNNGHVCHIRFPYEFSPESLPGGKLPPKALPIVGIRKIRSMLDYANTAYVLSGDTDKTLYRPFLTSEQKVEFEPRRSQKQGDRFLMVSQHFGELRAGELLSVSAILPVESGMPRLIGHSFDQESTPIKLKFWPGALVNTAGDTWLGDSGERILRWQWQDGDLMTDPDWPQSGFAVEGQISAMTLWPQFDEDVLNAYYLLVATDERLLFVINDQGRELTRIKIPHTITSMLAAPKGPYLFVAYDDNCLGCLEPAHPTLNLATPSITDAFSRLPVNVRSTIRQDWIQGSDFNLIRAAINSLVYDTINGVTIARQFLAGLVDESSLGHSARYEILDSLEECLLALENTNTSLVKISLKIARAWHSQGNLKIRRRIDLLTARLITHFEKIVERNDDYLWLRQARRQSDQGRAEQDLQSGRAQDALELYGQIMVERRELAWMFVTDSAIRALKPISDSPQIMLATRKGQLYLYDLTKQSKIDSYTLPAGAIPRDMSIGSMNGQEKDTLAIITNQGDLYLYPAQKSQNFDSLTSAGRLANDISSLALFPKQPRLVAGRSGGQLTQFVNDGRGGWKVEWSRNDLAAERLHSLGISIIEHNGQPAIFAGGVSVNGQGILYRLNIEGHIVNEFPFPDAVLDVRTIPDPDSAEKLIAVACMDGYLYLLNALGTLKWRYRAGRAVYNVTVCDIDNDGEKEIIIAGETRKKTNIIILSVQGAVLWVIPAEAPVTHMATALDEQGRSILLVADMEHVLRGIQVIPPRGFLEKEIGQKASLWLKTLSEEAKLSTSDLISQWRARGEPHYLQGFAFYHLTASALAGDQQALAELLNTDIKESDEAVQRAYARNLVNLATMEPADEARMKAARERLQALLLNEESWQIVGRAALRQLMLPQSLEGQDLGDWLPFFKEAAGHRKADIQRAVLYALRALKPIDEDIADLQPAAWTILTIVYNTAGDKENSWVREDMAALFRDLAGDEVTLWVLSHRILARMSDAAPIDKLLEGVKHPLLDNNSLGEAISWLVKLHGVTIPESAYKNMQSLTAEFIQAFSEKRFQAVIKPIQQTFLELYRLFQEAIQLRTFDEWERFINDNTPSGGFSCLIDLLADPRISNHRWLERHMLLIRDRINSFQNESEGKIDALSRLIDRLGQLAERLPATTKSYGQDTFNNNVFAHAVGGILWGWCREEGPLRKELDRLTQPASPQLELINAYYREDQLTLDVKIINPGFQHAFEDFRLRMDKTTIRFYEQVLDCDLETRSAHGDLTINAKMHTDLRLTAVLPKSEYKQRFKGERATLDLYVDYFMFPNHWYREVPLQVSGEVQDRTQALLNLETDFPEQYAAIRAEMIRELRRKSDQPILIESPPLIRQGVISLLRSLPDSRSAIVDMRIWLFRQQRFGDELRANEADMLAWIAEKIWLEEQAGIETIRAAGSPHDAFKLFTQKQRPLPDIIILNNWERLLFSLGRTGNQWQPLTTVLPFFVGWAQANQIRLVFTGTYLMEEILCARWPELFADIVPLRCDQLDINQAKVRRELTRAVDSILREEALQPVLNRFVIRPTAEWLVNWCRGYLQVLDFVGLRALEQGRVILPHAGSDLEQYLYDYAQRTNFFNSLWLWQPFFDRIVVVLVAHGEIPIERRDWIQEGMTLSRNYHSRTQTGRLVTEVTLPAGRTLNNNDVTIIKSNRQYQRYDAYVRGFIPGRVSPEDGLVGRLLQQLLSAGDGQHRLDRLVEGGIFHRKYDRRLGTYYEVGVPHYGRWLRKSGIWAHIQRVLDGQENNWFPAAMARDHYPNARDAAHPWLFDGLAPGAGFRDIPFASLPAIEQELSSQTRDPFFTFYGLSRRGSIPVADRWQALVNLARRLQEWQKFAGAEGERRPDMQRFFESLEVLLKVKRPERETDTEDNIPEQAGVRIFSSTAELFPGDLVLQRNVLLAVVRRGKELAEHAGLIRQWAREKLAKLHKAQEPGLTETEYVEMMERSVVICLAAIGAEELRRVLPPGRGGPHFIFLDMDQLTAFATAENPANELINHTFQITGRQPFSPYKLYGSLDKGSKLFVGRRREINAILGSLDREDHAILGSRRIGKTSLLHHLGYLLSEREPGQRPLTLSLNLLDASNVVDFYQQVKSALKSTPYASWGSDLSDTPVDGYYDLLKLMQRLREVSRQPVVLLIDEIDGLYLEDKFQNEQRFFQFLRNKLAQPRICTFIMTGYRYIYLERLKVSSVFHNFCRFHSLLDIEPEGVNQLVTMLRRLNLELEDQQGVEKLIKKGTYGIPYYVQLACDKLLNRADVLRRSVIRPADAEAILDGDIQRQLKKELWDELLVETLPLDSRLPGQSDELIRVRNLKIKVLLLSTLLELYQHQYQAGVSAKSQITFSATDMIGFAESLCPELCPQPWKVNEEEVHQLMVPVTMTLALAPAEADSEIYHFPNDILPDVLFSQERQNPVVDLLDELILLSQTLRRELREN